MDKTCPQHVLQEIFSPQPPTNIQMNNKARDERIEKSPTKEQINCSHSTESSNAAKINPKARDLDECMHSKPCQAYSSQEGANETAQPEGCN